MLELFTYKDLGLLCCDQRLLQRVRRRQALSPLVPAEAVLRAFPEATKAALLVLAEHTLTSAACGSAVVWAIRDQRMLLSTSRAHEELRSFSLCLRPGDVVAMADGHHQSDADPLKLAMECSPSAMVLRCELLASENAWSPLKEDRPHPSWAKTIFNE
eukprot:s177_g20.t1